MGTAPCHVPKFGTYPTAVKLFLLNAGYKQRCTEGTRSCNKTTNYKMLHFFSEVVVHAPYSRAGLQIDFVFALLLASLKPVNTGSALRTFSP